MSGPTLPSRLHRSRLHRRGLRAPGARRIDRIVRGCRWHGLLVLAVLVAGPLSAQYRPKPPRDMQPAVDSVWIWGQGLRLSFGVGQGSEGVAVLAVGSLVAGPGDVLVRMSHTGLLDRTVGDVAALYGLRAATPGGRLSARAGAGLGWVEQAYDGPRHNCRTQEHVAVILIFPVEWESTDCDQDRIEESGLGLALQLDATVGVTADWGFSVSGFANVGGPQGYHGFAVSFLRAF